MNILITNDDGYLSIGLRALASRLKSRHNVYIVAPSGERSGYSHLVNFFSGITYREEENFEGIPVFSVSGSPADCVLLAVKRLFCDVKFDAVISGINTVLNIGSDIIYSGTFGAAQEGTFHRIPSIAVSLRARGRENYDFAADFVRDNLDLLVGFAKDNVTVNVNIPDPDLQNIKGVRAAHVVYRPYDEGYVLTGKDGDNNDVYMVSGKPHPSSLADKEGDCYLSSQGYITISAVKMIANDYDVIQEIKKADFKL